MWDWDSWSTSIVLGQVEVDTDRRGRFAPYEQGSVLNFLDHTDDDGVMPVQLTPEKPSPTATPHAAGGFAENMHKPVLVAACGAAHAAARERRMDPALYDHDWPLRRPLPRKPRARRNWARLLADRLRRRRRQRSRRSIYRPNKSTAAVYLNSLLYRELLAYGYLLEELKDVPEANRRRRQAQDLADAMTRTCGTSATARSIQPTSGCGRLTLQDWLHRGAPRPWSSLLLRVDNWSSFLPMWAGLASREQAGRMVERIRDQRTFEAHIRHP